MEHRSVFSSILRNGSWPVRFLIVQPSASAKSRAFLEVIHSLLPLTHSRTSLGSSFFECFGEFVRPALLDVHDVFDRIDVQADETGMVVGHG